MHELTPAELKAMMDKKQDYQLIDVREPYEYENANIGAELIPMGEVLNNLDKISRTKTVIIHCKSGGRSRTIIDILEKQHGFTNLYNLKGGITAWRNEIDPTLPNP